MLLRCVERWTQSNKRKLTFLLFLGCLLTCANTSYSQTSIDRIPNENKHRWLGAKVEETADYALYEPGGGFISCSLITFMVVLKTYDDDYEISPDNPKYRSILENRIIPLVKRMCKSQRVKHFDISNFFQGVHLRYTEAEGFKEYKTGQFPGPSVGYSGGQEKDLNVRVYDPFGQVRYSESTYPLEDYASLNKLRKFNEVLVARYEQKKRDEIAREEERKREEAERLAAVEEAEKRRRLEELPQRIAADRIKASNTLALYKRGARKVYDFSGYPQQQPLRDIYAGNFEPFTGGYYSDVLRNVEQNYLATLLGMGGSSMSSQLEFARKMARLRLPIMIAYFAYHQAFEEQCYLKSHELPWIKGTRRTDLVTTRGGFEINRIEGQTYVYYVREPFFNTFKKTFEAAQQGNFAQLVSGTPLSTRQEFQDGFRKFLKTEGCSSPQVRHLEINLYLATEWMRSLQELLPPGTCDAPPNPVETQKPRTTIQKTKPAPKTAKPKSRIKSK